jgi:hypothetical protein
MPQLLYNSKVAGFEVLTEVVMKSSIFWDITPCSLLEVNRRLGLSPARISMKQATNSLKMVATLSSRTSLLCSKEPASDPYPGPG